MEGLQARTMLDFSHLSKPVQTHLKNVYGTLAASLFVATIGAFVHLVLNIQFPILSSLGSVALVLAVIFTEHTRENLGKRFLYLQGASFLTGMSLGPLLDSVIQLNPAIITTALLGTSSIFVCFSACALVTANRNFLYLGGILLSALNGMLLMSLANIFFQSYFMFKVELYLGFLVMCGFVLFDTQLIVERRNRGDDDYIRHSLDLFLDFINMFRRLLMILSSKEENKKKRRD